MKKIEQGSLFETESQKKSQTPHKENFFDEFDEATQLKLNILENYLISWLPVFQQQHHIKVINIFDFFSGKGKDSTGIKGSPLRILDIIKKFSSNKSTQINVFLNDKDFGAYQKLNHEVSKEAGDIHTLVSNLDFEECFKEHLPKIQAPNVANFLWLDPFGIINVDTIKIISKQKRTDFLMFIPLNYIYRFLNEQSIQNKYSGINEEKFKDIKTAHRNLKAYFQKHCSTDFYLHTFAIRKERSKNIYCLLFGSGHLLGLDKFIRNVWKIDTQNGDANFTFAGDSMLSFFDKGYTDGSIKVNEFQNNLALEIKNKKLLTNKDVYGYALLSGFPPTHKHVKKVLQDMANSGYINNPKVTLTYDSIHKKNNIQPLTFEEEKHENN